MKHFYILLLVSLCFTFESQCNIETSWNEGCQACCSDSYCTHQYPDVCEGHGGTPQGYDLSCYAEEPDDCAIVSCVECEEPDEEGCMDSNACNYDPNATVPDGCTYPMNVDCCDGNTYSLCSVHDCPVEVDECGVCGGDGLPCECAGPCGQEFDECGSVINNCFPCCMLGACGLAASAASCEAGFGTWHGGYLAAGFSCGVDGTGQGDPNPAPGDGSDCDNDGIPDDCEETYTYGYNAGYMNGVITGQISSDENNDGLVDDFPLITVLGGTVQVLTQSFDSEYTDAGATCFVGDTDISHTVVVSGAIVNFSTIGTYVLNYNCQDYVLGNQALTKYRTVIVQADYSDENNDGLIDDFPLITILGGTAVVLTQTFEGNYIDAGASCFAGGIDVSQNVELSGDVINLSNIGTYVMIYNCQDNFGNQAMTKHRTVIVQADYSDEDNDGYEDASYLAGLEEGILLGGQSGDSNGDGILNILDIVYFVDVILYP